MKFCAELRMALLDALNTTENLVVDVSRITELDISALQLLCAAKRSAIQRQKNMVLSDELSNAFYTAVHDSGFSRAFTVACLWDRFKPAESRAEFHFAASQEEARNEAASSVVARESQPESGRTRANFIRFKPCQELLISGTNPITLFKELAALGAVTITAQTINLPSLEEINPEFCFTSWDILLVSGCDSNAVKDVFMSVEDDSEELAIRTFDDIGDGGEQPNLGEILLQRGDITQEALEKFLREKKKIGEQLAEAGLVPVNVIESALDEQPLLKRLRKERISTEQQSAIRVPVERIDHLVKLAGRQVTVQARLSQLAQSLEMPELASIAEEVATLTAELRDSTRNIRMLPIGATIGKFRRLASALSSEQGKEK